MPRLSIAFLGTASIAAAVLAIIQVQAVETTSARGEPAAHSVSEFAPKPQLTDTVALETEGA